MNRSLQRPGRGGGGGGYALPYPAYSLPRHAATGMGRHPGGRSHPAELQPDFYFMPSQRKYSGEVVRVYVDYNK